MKKHIVRFTFLGVLALFLSACSSMQNMPWSKNPLAGNWKNSHGTVWMIKSDSTFSVTYDHGKKHASGKITIQGDTATISEPAGNVPKGCDGPGVYKFHRDGSKLTFTLVSDKCKLRKSEVLAGWKAVK